MRWGRLFHERFNNKDAADLFQEALERDPKNAQAFLGFALVSADGFDNKAVAEAKKALEFDPKLVEAHELLANLALEDSDTKAAAAEADEALKISPEALDAMAIHAAIEISGGPFSGRLARESAAGESHLRRSATPSSLTI